MRLPYVIVAILAASLFVEGTIAEERQASKKTRKGNRITRQTSADQMVQNILKWLQGVYTQQSRRSRFADYDDVFNFASDKLDDAFRQGTLREYLPPTNTQKPRPFETARPPSGDGIDINGNYIDGGYPPTGSITPQPPFPIFPGGGITGETYPTPGLGYPTSTFPGKTPPGSTGFPTGPPTGYPTGTTGPAGYPTSGFPTQAPETHVPGYPSYAPETPTPGFPTHVPETPTSGFPTHVPETPTPGFPTHVPETPTPGFPTHAPEIPTHAPETPTPGFPTHAPETPAPDTPTSSPETPTPGGFTGYPSGPSTPGGFTGYPGEQPTPGGFTDHPGEQPTPGGFTGHPGEQSTPGGFTGHPGGQPTPGGFTGYPSGQPTPGDFTGYPSVQPTPGVTGYPNGQPTPGEVTGYPSGQPTPGGTTGYPGGQPTPGFTPETPTHPPTGTTASTETPGFTTHPPPGVSTGYPDERPGFPTQPPPGFSTGYPNEKPGLSTQPPSELTTLHPGYPTTHSLPDVTTGSPFQPGVTETQGTSLRPALPTEPSVAETESPTSGPSTASPETPVYTSATTPEAQTPAESPTTQQSEGDTIPAEGSPTPGVTEAVKTEDEDLKHPPHIHAIDVECAKDMMTINIEFNREFNGVIYSKGYYNMPECRYVQENSGLTKYTFTVNLNMCGTEFINAFDTQGQSYLENVLVLQNEAGIQEIWDTVRAVRCLWEGNLKESLSVALSVGMLSQELVTFSGDTAIAKLDILLGRGALGQPANGLVKIGEPMTLVVSVSGDPGFDIQVKDCRATDSTGGKTIPLTDDNGCVLKPKLFGAFQKTRNTGDSGASIIAFAYFNAFKFPDVMDLMIECNIELCKTDCDMCTDPNQKLEPGRRKRRDLYSFNETLHDGVTMGKHLRIILPEDLNDNTIVDLGKNEGVCMSTQSFVFSTSLLISILTASCLFSAYMWLKTQHLKLIKK